MTMPVLVIYDFCDTLIDFQSANSFVYYVFKKAGSKSRFVELLRRIMARFHLFSFANLFYRHMSVNKALLLYQLKGYTKSELQNYAKLFYQEMVKPNLQDKLIKKLQSDLCKGNIVAIASGGYDIYLDLFCRDFGISHLICSSLVFENDVFTGRVYEDCIGVKKRDMVTKHFGRKELQDSFSKVIFYSDSKSDIPLFMLCTKKYVVINGVDVPAWIHKIGAEPFFR